MKEDDFGAERPTRPLDEACRQALAEAREEAAQLRRTYEATVRRLDELRRGICGLASQYDSDAADDFSWCAGGLKDALELRRKARAALKMNDQAPRRTTTSDGGHQHGRGLRGDR